MSAKQSNNILFGEYTPQGVYLKNNFYKSFNFSTIILIGGRGIGKTYGVLKHCVKDFIYNGKQFVWLRLTETECDKIKQDEGEKFLGEVCNSFRYPVKYDVVNYPTSADGKATKDMINEDGTIGAHWTLEQTNNVAKQYGVTFNHYNEYDWNYVMYMIYSDYYKVIPNDIQSYIKFAKAFLDDKDAKDKAFKYYYNVVK